MTHEINHSGLAFFEDGQQGNPVLVLGHALGADHRIWDQTTEALKDKFHIWRWDLPGHGSSAVLSDPLTMDHVVHLLVSGLEEQGITQFHVGGISMGGMAALATAASYPERVQSLAVLDAGPVLLPHSTWNERAALVRAEGTAAIVDATMSRWFTTDFLLGEGSQLCEQIRERYIGCDREGFARCCEVLAATDLRDSLQLVSARTLLLTGAEDEGMSPEALLELESSLSNAAVTTEVVQSTKHLTCVQAPERVTAALERLLAHE